MKAKQSKFAVSVSRCFLQKAIMAFRLGHQRGRKKWAD